MTTADDYNTAVLGIPAPAVGADLLDELRGVLVRYVVLPSDQAYDAVALWIATTHALPAFEYAPRLAVSSPEKRCGKSRLLDIIRATSYDPLITVNATSAAIFRRIGNDHPPTLLMDEADSLWGSKKAAESNEDLRALFNAGHQRNRPALRCVGPQQTPTEFPTFAMAALAGIGSLPDTITDRAVNITMRRRAAGESVAPFRHRRDEEPLTELRARLSAWAADHHDELEGAEPAMPVEDRAADTWEPLVAVAEAAGGSWPARARRAAKVMVAAADSADAEASDGMRLLGDCRAAFATARRPLLASKDLLTALRAVEESPWGTYELTAQGLAMRLRQYGIRPAQVRPDGPDAKQVRGYQLQDFKDAFARYLTAEDEDDSGAADPPSQVVTPSQVQVRPVTTHKPVTGQGVTDAQAVTGAQAADLHKPPSRDGVTTCDDPHARATAVVARVLQVGIGPCSGCGAGTRRYGEGATGPLCQSCRAAS